MAAWGREVLHVFDRGFAGEPWLEECRQAGIRFVMRWPKDYHLRDGQYRERSAWKIAQGKRSWGKRALWESHRQQWSQGGVVALPVTHPHVGGQFWLVVSRPGKGRLPWYLLTNEPIETEDDAWSIVFAYARRWRIEMAWRFTKSELGFESPRLWAWEPRIKLLMIASLAFAFLLSLLEVSSQGLRQDLLDQWCHRTGKRHLLAQMPLYRLREALSFLWLVIPPSIPPFQNSG
ncbi:hypothetical protein KSX_85230 [Ktedonospora formicarum]|uniref:Transposase IS4-like domain-containing protein n=2 Tax=Ktedonospora formicarum TaxID=2778364 RepID=A0A8J3MZ32_9CHLR|nr:hypothetical protein KSX_85230 [Ktedonospora formicarum]